MNITNGLEFDEYFKKHYQEESIAFNEALMIGDLYEDIFSLEFINKRIVDLNTTKEEYCTLLNDFINFSKNLNKYNEINLYFGDDVFCVINLISILSLLEINNYKGNVNYININEDDFSIIKNEKIRLGNYSSIYNCLVNKEKSMYNEFKTQIDMYYDYLSENGEIKTFIKNNILLETSELFKITIKKFKDYGITDIQISNIVKEIKNEKSI